MIIKEGFNECIVRRAGNNANIRGKDRCHGPGRMLLQKTARRGWHWGMLERWEGYRESCCKVVKGLIEVVDKLQKTVN
jgi:hypothetical protein